MNLYNYVDLDPEILDILIHIISIFVIFYVSYKIAKYLFDRIDCGYKKPIESFQVRYLKQKTRELVYNEKAFPDEEVTIKVFKKE